MKKSSKGTQSTAVSDFTDFDRAVEAVANREVSIRKGGEQHTMTAQEAVLEKQFATAIGGSPHAQNQFLRQAQRAAEFRREQMQQDIALWTERKQNLQRYFEAYRAEHGTDPELFPHPDDIEICLERGVRIEGPKSVQEHRQVQKARSSVDAWLHQDALDRARTKRRKDMTMKLGDSYTLANLANRSLPKRLRWSDDDLVIRRMELTQRPIRDLLKDTRKAWKVAGLDIPRGAYAPSPDYMARGLDACAEMIRWLQNNPDSRKDLRPFVAQSLRRNLM